MDKAAYPRNEMAFALSPLSLDRFPFKINPVVENMHLTATDEAFLVSTVFCEKFRVQTAHGSSRTEEDFRPSRHVLDIADDVNGPLNFKAPPPHEI